MGKRDTLNSIISTLSASEKRYLKLLGQVQPGDKLYLQLFDIMEKDPTIDSKKIVAKLNCSSKQLADNKHYLMQAIYKVLRTMEEPEWKAPELYKAVIDIHNLNDRRLFDSSLQLIEKTMEQAYHFEKYPVIITLLNAKITALIGTGKINELQQVSEELKKVSNIYHLFSEYVILGRQIQLLCATATDESKQQVRELLKHPLLQKKPGDFLCARTAIYWFNSYQQAYYLLGEQEKLTDITRQLVAYHQNTPHFMDIDAASVILSQITLSQVEIVSKNYDAAFTLLKNLLPFLTHPPKYLSPGQYSSVRFFILHTQAHLLLVTGNYRESYQTGMEIYKSMDDRSHPERYNVVHNIALSLLHMGKTSDAYKKLEELLQMGDDIRADLQMAVRPAIILTQLEMGHYEVVPYLIKSAKAWLKRKKISDEELNAFFHYTYAIAKSSPLQRNKAWANFSAAIESNEMPALNDSLYTLSSWLKARKRA